MSKRFIRTIEDFVCERCGKKVEGTGYTNHCPACLWSKHVDKNPGDRLEACGGMMEPFRAEREGKRDLIVFKCLKCGFQRRNELSAKDDFEAFIAIMKKASAER
ncbi:MAG: RNHCP domain-containing protein [Candidatus Taylorbacteria bacterium]|nr:RNHCP domain-containing protein [Candidatus Taylorbacteria bacterium]